MYIFFSQTLQNQIRHFNLFLISVFDISQVCESFFFINSLNEIDKKKTLYIFDDLVLLQ